MSIEDDIKRCKEIISKCDDCKFATCEQCEINWTDIQAIKIILGNLEALCDMQKSADRELEKARRINEEHKKENGELREKVKELKDKNILEKVAKEELEELLEDSIPKQKIKDLLTEIQEEYNKLDKEIDKQIKDKNKDYYKCKENIAIMQTLAYCRDKFEGLLEEK